VFLQVTEFEYDLVLQPDINTRGHTQWFFFAVSNMRAGEAYRFNIINLLKDDSTYNMGMLPLMHSEQQMRNKVRTEPYVFVRGEMGFMIAAICSSHNSCGCSCEHGLPATLPTATGLLALGEADCWALCSSAQSC
jgi:hypothetical protein